LPEFDRIVVRRTDAQTVAAAMRAFVERPVVPSTESAKPASPPFEPHWGYVLSPADLRDGTGRIIGKIQPGTWYLATEEADGRLRVQTSTDDLGWVDAADLKFVEQHP
jgi:hypothetical protein